MLNALDVFSGIGGLAIALKNWIRPIIYCENEPYCQGVLLSRMADGRIHRAPISTDVRQLEGKSFAMQSAPNHLFKNICDIITAGFPCQDISIAGTRKGLEGERSGLFFEIVRLAKEIKPSFIFLENVPGICTCGGLRVVREIAEMGYDCRWCVISAASIGAPHLRERWFLLAHAKSEREIISSGRQETFATACPQSFQSYWKETESPICGMDDGVPYRVDRIRSLGNAVVKSQAKKAFEMLMGLR